ncbi:MAG: hypothetical protein V4708_18360 [Bacteroidota bacterium]
MYQDGEVNIVKCRKCGTSFPVFIFVADTDTVTNGCVALSAPKNRIALTMQRLNESIEELELRIGSDYRVARVSFNEVASSAKGFSFQQFMKNYKPTIPTYSCIVCGAESEIIKTETKENFLTYGSIQVIKSR